MNNNQHQQSSFGTNGISYPFMDLSIHSSIPSILIPNCLSTDSSIHSLSFHQFLLSTICPLIHPSITSIHPPIHLSIHLFIHQSTCLCLPIDLFLFNHLAIQLPIHSFNYQSCHPSICHSLIHPYNYPSIHPFSKLSDHPSIYPTINFFF